MIERPGTALVTGAARRVGRAIAFHLAGQGWAVAVHYGTNGTDARKLAAEIERKGGRAVALKADLANEKAAAGLLPRATEALGPVTCLVNNASIFEQDTVHTADVRSWNRHMAVNLRAPFVLMQAFQAALPRKARGNVVNILDQRVWNLTPYFVSYTVSKTGLWTLTQTMALALAPRIRVNAIGPGPTLPSRRQTAAQFRRQWKAVPLARPAAPDEIARAVAFILETPSMTGQMIALDGGQHLGWGQVENRRTLDE